MASLKFVSKCPEPIGAQPIILPIDPLLVSRAVLALSSTIERIREYELTAEHLRQLSKDATSPEAQSEFSRCAQLYDKLADKSREHALRQAHARSHNTSSGSH